MRFPRFRRRRIVIHQHFTERLEVAPGNRPGLTTDRDDPRLDRGRAGSGMQEVYLVLSDDERAKGFVRPVRQSYVHVGRKICGKVGLEGHELPAGKKLWACSDKPDHEGECTSWRPLDDKQIDRFLATGYLGGCGVVTRMGLALSETYAREPGFYGATYCCGCGTHLPVGEYGEFVWDDDGQLVGT